MATDVDAVYRDFGTPNQAPVGRASAAEIRDLDLPAGSMGPKVEAGIAFAEHTGKPAAIGRLAEIRQRDRAWRARHAHRNRGRRGPGLDGGMSMTAARPRRRGGACQARAQASFGLHHLFILIVAGRDRDVDHPGGSLRLQRGRDADPGTYHRVEQNPPRSSSTSLTAPINGLYGITARTARSPITTAASCSARSTSRCSSS
jgi:hypothetical protein